MVIHCQTSEWNHDSGAQATHDGNRNENATKQRVRREEQRRGSAGNGGGGGEVNMFF